ncbi:MAG: antirestriction protein ArdA [Nocardioidaceae bacterium]|nr:antirestriction protein ArdA [Nocardioidaceae bacterium]
MHEQQPHEHEHEPRLRPRIWVGSLSDYNAGRLHGEWIDAAVDTDTLNESVRAILAASPDPGAEEFAIFDYDEFGSYRPDEYEPLDHVARVARGIAEHGPAFAAFAYLHDGTPDFLDGFSDAYMGHFTSGEDWARETIGDLDLEKQLDEAVPAALRGYVQIDYEGWARDAQISGDVAVEDADDGGVWVFRSI